MPIDYSKYPDNWLTEIRPNILKRACNSCEMCGLKNHWIVRRFKPNPAITSRINAGTLWHTPIKIVITIAHLDQDITNNDHKNLMALCQRCHIIWDKKHKRKKRGTGQ